MDISIAQREPSRNLELTQILERWELEKVVDIVSIAKTSTELAVQAIKFKPQLIITDVEEEKTILALEKIKNILPEVKILIYAEAIDLDKYLGLVDGYCHYNNSRQLLTAVKVISTGAIYWDYQLKELITKKMQALFNPNLSHKEIVILNFIAQGKSNIEIADYLNLSHHTIKNYVQKIMNKLIVNNRTEMVSKALRSGLIS